MNETNDRTVKIDDSFSFDVKNGHYKTKDAWAKVRIKKDEKRGDYYIDVLVGRKGDKCPHIHMGINADQSERFRESRGILHTMSRRAVDSKLGVIEDKAIKLKPQEGKFRFTFTVVIDEPSKTIKVLFGNAKLE